MKYGLYVKSNISSPPVLFSSGTKEEMVALIKRDYEMMKHLYPDTGWHIEDVQFSYVSMGSQNPSHRFFFIAPL